MRRPAVLIGLTGPLLLVGGVAAASIPDSIGMIHACVKDGKVRVIDPDAGQSCTSAERSLSWSQRVAVIRFEHTATVDPGELNQATAACPDDFVVTGGGIDIEGTDPGGRNVQLVERYSGPVSDGRAWTLGMTNTGTTTTDFTVIALCVPGTSRHR